MQKKLKRSDKMIELTFNDLLRKAGIDPSKVVLVRHAFNRESFKRIYDGVKAPNKSDDKSSKNNKIEKVELAKEERIKLYTAIQKTKYSNFKRGEYFAVFISSEGASATFYCLYKVKATQPFNKDEISKEYFEMVPDDLAFTAENANYFVLERDTSLLSTYNDRLVVNWGTPTQNNWHQIAKDRDKTIIALRDKLNFPGYDEVILDFQKLKEIMDDPDLYQAWHKALENVFGIYLILDKSTGNQYVGSAYGTEGILGRWNSYISSKGTGGNEGLKELLRTKPMAYINFQFSILQILPKNLTKDEVIAIENRFKEKLGSRVFGHNKN